MAVKRLQQKHTTPDRAMSARSDDTAMSTNGRVGSLMDLTIVTDGDSCSSGGASSSSSPKMRQIPAGRRAAAGVKLTQQLLEAVAVNSEDNHTDELVMSEGMMSDEQPRLPLLIVHAATSSTYPLVLMEGWNYNLDFFDAHPPPFRCGVLLHCLAVGNSQAFNTTSLLLQVCWGIVHCTGGHRKHRP